MSLKNLFIKEDLITPTTKTTPNTNYVQTNISNNIYPIAQAANNIDSEVKSALLQSLQDNKLSGFDYLKFVAALEQMKSVAPSEDSRFKMTFIAAQQLGVDKAKLIESANHYLDVLKQDLTEFRANLNSKQGEIVELNQTRLNEVNNNILALQTQLQQLTDESSKLTSKISENKVKLENKKNTFEVTHASIVGEITTNIQKINQYL